MAQNKERYAGIVIFWHWLMALCFLAMIAAGLIMEYAPLDKSFQFQLYQWHKSLGLLLLIAFFMRLVSRLVTRTPALPEGLANWENKAAKAGHYSLYLWMLIVPLSGWLMVSSSSYGLPTYIFGLFEWPHIPGLEGNKAIHETAELGHKILTWSFTALIAIHIGAVIKHAWADKINLLKRMGIGRR